MSLLPGTRIGAYEVVAQIGAGGMGEVYRATDTNLKRQVALKVLPVLVAGDADRLARFQREAEVLAALNHPHIAQIYGVEKSATGTALVMELVEGEDLSQRISRGAVPLDEALPIARQIAEGLEAAHEQGILHRDLKPANIKVRADGTVKVLDFGLAKALEPAGASHDASQSPTITSPAMLTSAGMILGTAAYMSPEQAKGRPADRQSDIWAFGCVLFEMLAGRRAFEGEDVADTMAAVLRGDPDWRALPAGLSSGVTVVLRRSLARDRRNRLRDIGDARFLLDDLTAAPVADGPQRIVAMRRRESVAWVLSALLLAVLGGAFLVRSRQSTPSVPTRFSIQPPDAVSLTGGGNQNLGRPLSRRTTARVRGGTRGPAGALAPRLQRTGGRAPRRYRPCVPSVLVARRPRDWVLR